jgi:hypothetical protein
MGKGAEDGEGGEDKPFQVNRLVLLTDKSR